MTQENNTPDPDDNSNWNPFPGTPSSKADREEEKITMTNPQKTPQEPPQGTQHPGDTHYPTKPPQSPQEGSSTPEEDQVFWQTQPTTSTHGGTHGGLHPDIADNTPGGHNYPGNKADWGAQRNPQERLSFSQGQANSGQGSSGPRNTQWTPRPQGTHQGGNHQEPLRTTQWGNRQNYNPGYGVNTASPTYSGTVKSNWPKVLVDKRNQLLFSLVSLVLTLGTIAGIILPIYYIFYLDSTQEKDKSAKVISWIAIILPLATLVFMGLLGLFMGIAGLNALSMT